MNEDWTMVATGVFLVIFGLAMTHISGAMPGAKPLYPPPLRSRLILICFGVFMVVLGAARLIDK